MHVASPSLYTFIGPAAAAAPLYLRHVIPHFPLHNPPQQLMWFSVVGHVATMPQLFTAQRLGKDDRHT